MNDRNYKLMTIRLIDELVPGSDKERRTLHIRLIATSDYLKAHGLYVFECETNDKNHVGSTEVLTDKIKFLIAKHL